MLKDAMEKYKPLFDGFSGNTRKKIAFVAAAVFTIICMLCLYIFFAKTDYNNNTIARITAITEDENTGEEDRDSSGAELKGQQITAVIVNGSHKGEEIRLQNVAHSSQAFGLDFKVNEEIIVTIQEGPDNRIISAGIVDFKRDRYIAYAAVLFMLLILLVGGFKGFRSLVSLTVNIIIFSAAVELLLHGYSPVLVASIASILFITVTVSIVSGINRKTVSAMAGTAAGTLVSILIAVIVIRVTHTSGIGYQESDFLMHLPPESKFNFEEIFLIEILIGTLGAIMDIAISISSAIKEIYDKKPDIDRKSLVNSAMEIGKDIMGTMANTLVFAYISGSIPLMLVLLKNGIAFFTIINVNISLEIIRALTGSIGIVVSIPITIFIAVRLLNDHRVEEG